MLTLFHAGALREDQQAEAVLQAFDRGFDRADIAVAPVYGKGAHAADKAADNGYLEQLLLCHDPQREIAGQRAHQQHGIPPAGMVGADQHRLVRKIFPALNVQRMQQQNERPQQLPHKGIEFVLHRPTFSRMISSSFSLLCWKSRSLVSTITASSAARSGAAERCVSL